MKDYPYFKSKELICKCGKCGGGQMNDEFMRYLIIIRTECCFPFIITSAYRCEEHNKKVGGSANSAHTKGLAVDIRCNGDQAYTVIKQAMGYPIYGIGIAQKGNSRYVHLDRGEGKYRVWTY